MVNIPSIEELLDLVQRAFATLIDDIMRLSDWMSDKLNELRDSW